MATAAAADRATGGGRRMAKQSTTSGLSSIARYPKGVFFCLGNEFAERFSYYGMRAVLTLYLVTIHDMEASTAKLFFHSFVSVAYFTPVLGSIVADGFLGRYRVILYVSILYCLGHILLSAGAVVSLGSEALKALDFVGLFVIAVSTGGIKPCVSAFAADQFPETMYYERKQFFSFFYFSINLGALISNIITPLLRQHHCLGQENCFPLAFGIPAIFMVVATVVFWAGTRFYKIVPKAKENVIVRVCKCVVYALRERHAGRAPKTSVVSESNGGKRHWLDYARPKYDQALIDDIKTLFGVITLYIPVIFFWSLFDQLGSTWVLQANAMNGRVGKLTVLPDQMPVLNPLLIIIMVPILEGVAYPILSQCNILVRPLRRMGWGGLLAATSFVVAGLVQLRVDKTSVIPPQAMYGRLVMISYSSEQISVHSETTNFTLQAGDTTAIYRTDVKGDLTVESRTAFSTSVVPIIPDQGTFVVLFGSSANTTTIDYDLKKTAGGKTRLYAVIEDNPQNVEGSSVNHLRSILVMQNGQVKGEILANSTLYADLEPELWGSNTYELYLKSCRVNAPSEANNSNLSSSSCVLNVLPSYTAEMGAADAIVVRPADADAARFAELIPANTVSVLWQMPQYLIITLGEALFSITGLEFSYSEASPSMKSVLTAIWLLTTAFGNVIDMIISGSGLIKNDPAGEFFVYAALMIVVMVVFIILAWRYKSASSAADAANNITGTELVDNHHPQPPPGKSDLTALERND